jgi:transposase
MAYMGKSLESVEREDMTRKCTDCGSTDIDLENEEFFCKKCGLVLD